MMTREEHCSHPEQAWCDCDWCRLVHADQAKRERKNAARRERDRLMRDMGLTKVRGAVSGRTYWE